MADYWTRAPYLELFYHLNGANSAASLMGSGSRPTIWQNSQTVFPPSQDRRPPVTPDGTSTAWLNAKDSRSETQRQS
jgi:hypothetical protein